MRFDRSQLILLALIWTAFAILAGLTILATDANFIMLGILAGAAIFGTSSVVEQGGSKDEEDEAAERELGEKNKRSASDTTALLALLDADDIAELRARIKNRLIRQIDGGSDGELTSLDALLRRSNE